jgi:hypothetical protein
MSEMKYKLLDSLKAKTKEGEVELQAGQIVTLPHDIAIKLLNEGRIKLIERVAYKVYSSILQSYLWIVDTDQDLHTLKDQGIKEPVYTLEECKKLKGLAKSSLRELHEVKKNFDTSVIREVKKKS